jgi:ankyrin repeat protein
MDVPSLADAPSSSRQKGQKRIYKFDPRIDVPTSANPFDINRITEQLKKFRRMELDLIILISLLDTQMRETISLDCEVLGCILQVIKKLLAQNEKQRDFASANSDLDEKMQTMKQEELSSYRTLIEQRTHVIKNGVEVEITEEKKVELLNSFDVLVDLKIAKAMREFRVNSNLNLAEMQDTLEQRIEQRVLLHDGILDSKTVYNMRYDAIKDIPEFRQLMEEKQKLTRGYLSSTIWEAVENGHLDRVKEELQSHPDPKAQNLQTDPKAQNPFLRFYNNLFDQEKVVTQEKFIDKTNSLGYTPLHIAAYRGHENIIDFLLQNGASMQITDQYGYNALHWAASQGYVSICRRFLENDPSIVNAQALANNNQAIEFGFNRTALHRAAWHGHAEIVNLLIEFNADTNLQTTEQDNCVTPLHEAIAQERDGAVVALLKSDQLNVEIKDARGKTPIYYAILRSKTEHVAAIIAHPSYKTGKAQSDPNSIESLLTVKPINKSDSARVKQFLEDLKASRYH